MQDLTPCPRHTLFPRWRVFLISLFLGLGLSVNALAASPSFSGTYQLDLEASDDIAAALEPALSELNIFKRAIGQKMLNRRLLPDLEQIDIEAITTSRLAIPRECRTDRVR